MQKQEMAEKTSFSLFSVWNCEAGRGWRLCRNAAAGVFWRRAGKQDEIFLQWLSFQGGYFLTQVKNKPAGLLKKVFLLASLSS